MIYAQRSNRLVYLHSKSIKTKDQYDPKLLESFAEELSNNPDI